MDPKTLQLLMGSAGAGAVADNLYIEDVFSTFLYTGTGATQAITNGIDLSGKGGLVWFKNRTNPISSALIDTARGPNVGLASDTSGQNLSGFFPTFFTGFTSSGFGLGSAVGELNQNSNSYVSWTFRKAPKFFDVVTYTGNGVNPRTLPHSLGSVPGFILLKSTSTSGQWIALARKTDTAYSLLYLNTADPENISFDPASNNITSTTFSPSFSGGNTNGVSYVAYLFAHNAGGFGDSGNDSVISCGSYTGNGSTVGPTVTLGWEPQWLLIKSAVGSGDWSIFDNLRGIPVGSGDAVLKANLSGAELTNTNLVDVNATGFQLTSPDNFFNGSGRTYIYIAIRRGPMKTPTDATKVFDCELGNSSGNSVTPEFIANFPVDFYFLKSKESANNYFWLDRIRGDFLYLQSASTSAETNWGDFGGFDNMLGCYQGPLDNSFIAYMFRRAPGFFDVVAYTGDGLSNRAIAHNLSVTPELIIVKSRNNGASWRVWSAAFTDTSANLDLNNNAAPPFANNFFPASGRNISNFIVNSFINTGSTTYIAYLFASCPGISKTGSYTGTGTTLNVDCGFTNGARFVLIKRTDNTGDWYVWDTTRGIISGNDPYLLLNSDNAQVTITDSIDPLSSGFQISSTAPVAINASGGTYIYLAIA
jgi:hypothetical protein